MLLLQNFYLWKLFFEQNCCTFLENHVLSPIELRLRPEVAEGKWLTWRAWPSVLVHSERSYRLNFIQSQTRSKTLSNSSPVHSQSILPLVSGRESLELSHSSSRALQTSASRKEETQEETWDLGEAGTRCSLPPSSTPEGEEKKRRELGPSSFFGREDRSALPSRLRPHQGQK